MLRSGVLPTPPGALVTIHHFAGSQNAVFVPALLLLLVATVAICLPIVLAPGIRKAGRSRPVALIAGLVAVVALVATAAEAGAAFHGLGTERSVVRAELNRGYDLDLNADEVQELVDGGEVERTMPDRAAALGVRKPRSKHPLRLVPSKTEPDDYTLTFGGVPLRTT